MSDLRAVGTNAVRIDGLDKVSAGARFADDLEFGPGLLHAQIISSTEAHALIKHIHLDEAARAPDVVKVFTGRDFPFKFGLYMQDRYVFAQDRVRFVGEQVAAVVARTPEAARRAAALVRVTYEPLPAILDQMTALREDAALIHPELATYPHVPWFFPQKDTNIAHWRKVRKGDLAQGFRDADMIVEEEYEVPRYVHCAIEPHVATALFDQAGRLTVWASSQSPYVQRHLFAAALSSMGISHKDVRVIAPYVGGGFGGKAGVTMEIIPAMLATRLKGHPVKLRFSREEEFANTYQRPRVRARIKMGVKKDGGITACEHKLYWDAGAYVEYGANVVNATGLSATGPYRMDNVSIDSICIYTNLPPGGPYRGFGYPEVLFGMESHLDIIAGRLGMDRVELRRRNIIRENDSLAYGAPMNPNGLTEAIDRVTAAIEWGNKPTPTAEHQVIGQGFALFWKAPAMPPNASSSAMLKFNEDGSINLLVAGVDLGQGYQTVMAQFAAEILGIPVHKVRVATTDTDSTPYQWQTVASHVTWSCGNAVIKAACSARTQIFELVERARHLPAWSLILEDEAVRCTTDPSFRLPLKDFVVQGIAMEDGTFRGGPITGQGTFMPEYVSAGGDPETAQGGHPNVHYTVGAAAVTLQIDTQTGKMRVLKAVEAVDAGKAINPSLAKGQIVGGLVQGLATVLYEDIRFDSGGKILNPNFTDYKIPTCLDIPDEIVPILIEVPQPDGPFGARGIGEHTMLPVAPMIASAIDDALGIRIKSMPLTAQKVVEAMTAKTKEGI